MDKVTYLIAVLFVFINFCDGTKETFKHKVEVDDKKLGKLQLDSQGRFADIIHLDTEAGIKRILCIHDKIMIAFEENVALPDWKPGQILLGGSKWACALATEAGGEHAGIYAKVLQAFRPKSDRIDLLLGSVGPFDLLDEATIHFHYNPSPLPTQLHHKSSKRKSLRDAVIANNVSPLRKQQQGSRHKRGVSNMLTDILNRIDWHTNTSMFVPFNYDQSNRRESGQFFVHRKNGSEQMTVGIGSTGAKQLLTPPDYFSLDCISCSSVSRLTYSFDLKIDKIDNKPVLRQYISQVESEMHMKTDFALRFRDEMSINGSLLFWRTQPKELLKIPLAKVPGLPPVELLLSYDMDIIADIHAAVNGPALLRNKYTTMGSYVMTQSMSTGSEINGDVSVFNWTVTPEHSRSILPSLADVRTSFKYRMGFNASLVWAGKDVSITLSPQADITIEPDVTNTVTSDSFGKCLWSDISVAGAFQIQDAFFHVQAFGLELWNKYLASGYKKTYPLTQTHLGDECKANCLGPTVVGFPFSVDMVLGNSTEHIGRNHVDFTRHLRLMRGDSIKFSNATETSMCPDFTSSCRSCDDLSNHVINACSARLVSRTMAESLVMLQNYVKYEWPDRRLVVMEGWDEVSNLTSEGRHNVTSPYRDGRVMLLGITDDTENTTSLLSDNVQLYRRLSQLAVCSKFDYSAVKNESGQLILELGVEKDDVRVHPDIQSPEKLKIFNKAMHTLASRTLRCTTAVSYNVGDTYPVGPINSRIGPPTGPVLYLSLEANQSLYEYPFDDLKFKPEGSAENWCGNELRSCSSCSVTPTSGIDVSWDSCITRLMTPRLALRMRKLANVAKRLSLDVQVVKALSVTSTEKFTSSNGAFFEEGRAARLTLLSTRTPADMSSLMNAAVCAGFDYVRFTSSEFVDVFVRRQDGYTESKTFFPNGRGLQASRAAGNLSAEYSYPSELVNEARQPQLLDGHNDDQFISKFYKVSDFKDKKHRDLRLDSSLVECLEEASEELGRKIEIVPGSAYRVRSVNFENIDTRHTEERSRFQAGQAVEVNLGKVTKSRDLVNLGHILIRKCQPLLQQQQRCIAIGCHSDRLYVDVRPVQAHTETALVNVWNNGGDTVYKELKEAADYVNNGGPLICTLHRTSACQTSTMVSPGKPYLSFQLGYTAQCMGSGSKGRSDFCEKTKQDRSSEADKLQDHLSSAAGSDRLPRRDIINEIRACVVDACGGCAGSGPEWDRKVRTCSKMIQKYLSRASSPFRLLSNRTTFYNPDNPKSTVHSLACHDGQLCVENVQLYSLLMPLVTSTYRVSSENSVEERLFSNEDNPSPLLELVAQELAYHTSGMVKVYIDSMSDLSRIRNVLKVVMAFNKNVSHVEFHISHDVNKDSVMATIQRKIETWAGIVCSDVSRLSLTPFSVHSIDEHRIRRSAERSEDRNQAKLDIKNWEMEWLMKL